MIKGTEQKETTNMPFLYYKDNFAGLHPYFFLDILKKPVAYVNSGASSGTSIDL